jgi:hypothetical protein
MFLTYFVNPIISLQRDEVPIVISGRAGGQRKAVPGPILRHCFLVIFCYVTFENKDYGIPGLHQILVLHVLYLL